MSESPEVSGFPGSWTPPDIVNFFSGREKADFVADLIAAFRTDITEHLRALEGAAADSDTRRIQQVSRAITSSAAQMGADALAAMSCDLGLAAGTKPADGFMERVDALHRCFESVYRDMLEQWSNLDRDPRTLGEALPLTA